ncbi:MAG TPA: fumarylacetoacetate hydrolase family protein [Pseudomonadales bacterium]|nr:fumarylacetoacetate hydrolase family protein [Pseudomonadales bacterium]
MAADLFPAPSLPRLALLDDDDEPVARFPVGRVFCVGRNYAAHAREMGKDPEREAPFFFMKPASAVASGDTIAYPSLTEDLHHEVELVVAIGRPLAGDVHAHAGGDVLAAVAGCGVGIDFTRRDLQAVAKDAGRPWEAGKVFDGAAACGALRLGHGALVEPDRRIRLAVDGEARQSGTLGQMIWTAEEVIRRLAQLFGLRAGDLVFTGTPAGVGAVVRGAVLQARVDGLPPLDVRIV